MDYTAYKILEVGKYFNYANKDFITLNVDKKHLDLFTTINNESIILYHKKENKYYVLDNISFINIENDEYENEYSVKFKLHYFDKFLEKGTIKDITKHIKRKTVIDKLLNSSI